MEGVKELEEVCVGLEAISCSSVVLAETVVVVLGDESVVAVDKDAGAVDVVLSSDAFVSERCERASGVRSNKVSAAGEPQKDNVRRTWSGESVRSTARKIGGGAGEAF